MGQTPLVTWGLTWCVCKMWNRTIFHSLHIEVEHSREKQCSCQIDQQLLGLIFVEQGLSHAIAKLGLCCLNLIVWQTILKPQHNG